MATSSQNSVIPDHSSPSDIVPTSQIEIPQPTTTHTNVPFPIQNFEEKIQKAQKTKNDEALISNALEKSGLNNGLKAQLRSNVVAALMGNFETKLKMGGLENVNGNSLMAASGSDVKPALRGSEMSLIQRVTASLIIDYLKHTGKSYALGVFLPESGLSPIDVLILLTIFQYCVSRCRDLKCVWLKVSRPEMCVLKLYLKCVF